MLGIVNDRIARYAIRGLVVLAMWAAIAAEIGARLVLSHGSGTYFALLVFLPLLVAPGALAWRWPRARSLAAWSGFGWACTIVWSIFGTPYHYERALEHWKFVAMPVWIAIALVLFVAPVIAMLMVKSGEVPAEHELLAQRIRRISGVVVLLATGVIVTSFVIAGADAFIVAVFTMLLIWPAALVQRSGLRTPALLWSAWCVPFAAIGVLLWLELGTVTHTGAKLVGAGLGTIFVLLLFGLPAACLTRNGPFTGSAARDSYRSHSR